MTLSTTRSVSLVAVAALAGSLFGCSTNAPAPTKAEEKQFKGGPMPEEARKIVEERMRAAGANGGPPAGAPGGPAAAPKKP